MRSSLILSFVFALALGTAFAAVQSSFVGVPAQNHTRQNPLACNQEAAIAGAGLYCEHCAQCHQTDAQGDGKKKPTLRSVEVRSATDGDLEWFLRQGNLRHGMPSWSSLAQTQRWAIISYLRTLRREPGARAQE
jgi:mono/diheme cytochrome c family protein